MKHAYLIIAHSEYPILQILLSMLDEYGNDVYLHIDKRAKVLHRELKSFKMDKAGFFILENPIKEEFYKLKYCSTVVYMVSRA